MAHEGHARRRTAILAAACVLAGRPAAPQQTPSFEAKREVVRIDVVALGRDGKPVAGLTADDFEIVEKGTRLPITSFEAVVVTPAAALPPGPAPASDGTAPAPPAPERNRGFVVLFDDRDMGRGSAFRAQTDLARFLESGELVEGDLVSLVTTSGVRFTARTAGERQRMAQVVRTLKGGRDEEFDIDRDGIRPGQTDHQAMQAARGGDLDPFTNRHARSGASSAQSALQYERAQRRAADGLVAIARALVALEGFRGRKSLLVYSEGFVLSPDVPQFEQVVELARRTRVSIFFADTYADGGDGTPAAGRLPGQREGRRHMRLQGEAAGTAGVAVATGGRAASTADLSVLFREAAQQAATYYLLGFEPPEDASDQRKIEVRSKKGLTLRAPDRYFVGGTTAPADAAAALRTAMASMFDSDEVPFTVATGSRGGVSSTTFVVSLARAAADPERRLDLRIEARPLSGGEPVRDASELTVPRGATPARLTRDLPLRPGAWQARVAVRDRDSGRVGSVLHTFEVKDAAASAP